MCLFLLERFSTTGRQLVRRGPGGGGGLYQVLICQVGPVFALTELRSTMWFIQAIGSAPH
jgi:hypothetical protein